MANTSKMILTAGVALALGASSQTFGQSATIPAPAAPTAAPTPAAVSAFNSKFFKTNEPTVISTGHKFTEGPAWVAPSKEFPNGCLLFTDIPGDEISIWTPGADKAKPLATVGSTIAIDGPSGLSRVGPTTWAATLATRSVALVNLKPAAEMSDSKEATDAAIDKVTELATSFEGKLLNSPNDLAIIDRAKDGQRGLALAFTDPPYFRPQKERELDFAGVYLVTRTSDVEPATVTLISKDLRMPNGIAVCPASQTLYVNDAGTSIMYSASIAVNEITKSVSVGPLTEFVKLDKSKGRGLADGLKVHPTTGNIYSTGPGGVFVISPAGQVLEHLEVKGGAPSNLCLNHDATVMYMTRGNRVLMIELATAP
jgi:sugar lactone lactonase YvrE